PARAPVNLDAWLRERVGEHVVPDDIRLQLELACGAIVAVDSQRLGQALDNVMVNACQAMQESQASQKIVRISSCSTGQNAEIQITDTGPGIPLDHQAKVFEPLFSTKSFGVGLGLPLVKQVLEQHGGDVILASEPGQGTCVTLRLPLG
ncbi:MAG: ATP-binding protein, partial [Candidatus Competibacteraceae bacterium]|nr:ATP-binding protein [Candidatus Competibacteraceae bacterium]